MSCCLLLSKFTTPRTSCNSLNQNLMQNELRKRMRKVFVLECEKKKFMTSSKLQGMNYETFSCFCELCADKMHPFPKWSKNVHSQLPSSALFASFFLHGS